MKSNEILLNIENLTIGFARRRKINTVVDHVTLEVNKGEILGIAGESGSGKTMTVLAVMGLLPVSAKILSGGIHFLGKNLLTMEEKELRRLRGAEISMVFQDSMTSFNPLLTIGAQVEEMLRLHSSLAKEEYRILTLKALEEVGLAPEVYHMYPHQLSGGMRQRAMIAMAMIAGPKLVIADEPTTALDVTTQGKILELLKEMNVKHGTGIILISHDLRVIQSVCDRAVIMKDGRIVESGAAKVLFAHPENEYTRQLVESAPVLFSETGALLKGLDGETFFDCNKDEGEINGNVVQDGTELDMDPNGTNINKDRNETAVCSEWNGSNLKEDRTGTDLNTGPGKDHGEDQAKNQTRDQTRVQNKGKNKNQDKDQEEILIIKNLNVFYPEKGIVLPGKRSRKQVIRNVTISVRQGETLGIIGESGSGKSTLAKAIVGLDTEVEGVIKINGIAAAGSEMSVSRPQMVFQDPYGSLNPMKKIAWILEEPLKLQTNLGKKERMQRVNEMIRQVGLSPEHLERYPHQLSGGQRQRAAIAAALIVNPGLVILDEPVSSLDVTIQAQILCLLKELQKKYNLTYIFISHDLSVTFRFCDRICVIYRGEIAEVKEAGELLCRPQHEYTKELIRSAMLLTA